MKKGIFNGQKFKSLDLTVFVKKKKWKLWKDIRINPSFVSTY